MGDMTVYLIQWKPWTKDGMGGGGEKKQTKLLKNIKKNNKQKR